MKKGKQLLAGVLTLAVLFGALPAALAVEGSVLPDNPAAQVLDESENSESYRIDFDPNGGTVSVEYKMTVNDRLSSLPTPSLEGNTFEGWYTELEGGEKVTTSTVFTCDTTLYAHWSPIDAEAAVVTFDANGGVCSTLSLTVNSAGNLTRLPTPTFEGYTFIGWYTEFEGGSEVTLNTVFDLDTTVYAHWKMNGSETIYVTFDATGGTVTPDYMTATAAGKLSSLPTPTLAGFYFAGWYTDPLEGTKISTSTVFTQDTTVYAHWSLTSVGTYQIRFDPYGGTVTTTTMTTSTSGKLSSLPTPTLDGYTFDGWYTDEVGGERISTSTVFTESTTVYARWTPNLEDKIADIAGSIQSSLKSQRGLFVVFGVLVLVWIWIKKS